MRELTIACLLAVCAAACGGATDETGDAGVDPSAGSGNAASGSGNDAGSGAGGGADSMAGAPGDGGSAQGGAGAAVRGPFPVLAVGPGGGEMCGAPAPEMLSFDGPPGTIEVREDAGELSVAFEALGIPCLDGQSFSASESGDIVSFDAPLDVAPDESPRRLHFIFHPSFREPAPYVGFIDEEVMLEPDPGDPTEPMYQRSGGYHFWLVE